MPGGNKGTTSGKVYQLLPDKENTDLEICPMIDLFLCVLLVSVKEVRSPASESESSDVEARSTGEATPPSTPGTIRTERKAIGRSASVTSSGPFVATPEWVRFRNFFLKRPFPHSNDQWCWVEVRVDKNTIT